MKIQSSRKSNHHLLQKEVQVERCSRDRNVVSTKRDHMIPTTEVEEVTTEVTIEVTSEVEKELIATVAEVVNTTAEVEVATGKTAEVVIIKTELREVRILTNNKMSPKVEMPLKTPTTTLT